MHQIRKPQFSTGVSIEGGVPVVSSQDTPYLLHISIKIYPLNKTRNKAFTKNAIISILVGVFKHIPKKNDNRGALLEILNALFE